MVLLLYYCCTTRSTLYCFLFPMGVDDAGGLLNSRTSLQTEQPTPVCMTALARRYMIESVTEYCLYCGIDPVLAYKCYTSTCSR